MIPTYVAGTDDVRPALREGRSLCVIEESTQYPGELSFFAPDQEAFVRQHSDYISSFSLLSELFMYGNLIDALGKSGRQAFVLPSAKPIIEKYREWSQPLDVAGLDLGEGKELFPFQQFAIRRAIDSQNHRLSKDGFFFNFGTGTGKSVIAAAGAQEMHNRGLADLTLAFTLRKNKVNLARQIETITQLKAEVIDGSKDRRRKRYAETTANVLVLNYEKCKFDYEEIADLIVGRNVLFVCDEVQLVLRGDNDRNKSRQALDKLFKLANTASVWPMSASIVKSSPLRYHDVYDLSSNKNPLGTRKDFIDRYCPKVETYVMGNGVKLKRYHWDLHELVEVRHRVSRQTMAVRKTDPGVREFFKGMRTEAIYVQPSRDEQRIADTLREWAAEDDDRVAQYYACLRYIANTPAALRYSESEVAQRMTLEHPDWVMRTPSSKFEMIIDKISQIRDQGDQVVVFTQWTYLTLFLLAKELKAHRIPYVTHYGTGMTDAEAQDAQDRFKADPDLTVFLSSDAGAYGLNFQNARYVINVESPYDPDTLMQRNDRIDRADSHLDGLTAYVYIVEGSVEEQVWAINEARRAVSAATQGTVENLSRYSAEQLAMTESQAMRLLVRGGLAPR
ncbi:DNA helicase [Gordonia phage RedWattleHog]|uniref:DNA helicase n=1 Tax=Gordonia phage Stormageddon TaxID=2656541 RepID=A0A649VSK7_9CAUD|nr:DNA helicase [Gordonia phage Stormageddon]QGJ94922.1 DNA helicase [Gordonia phage Stormageddon]QLF83566.1 DNA helicase [Gordonia phage RedWattleHog]